MTRHLVPLSEQEVDERLEALLDLEEPERLYDLRGVNPGRSCQFSTYSGRSQQSSWTRYVILRTRLDDKHKVQVGEPNCPVAAAKRGRQVLVHSSTSFFMGDHDFTRKSIIPSVSLLVDIPEELARSWYTC